MFIFLKNISLTELLRFLPFEDFYFVIYISYTLCLKQQFYLLTAKLQQQLCTKKLLSCVYTMQPVVTTSCNNRLCNRLVVVFTLCSMLRQLLCQLLLDRLHLATGCCNWLYNHVVQSVCAMPTPCHNDVTYVIAVCCSTIFVFSGSTMHEDDDDDLFIAATTAAAVAIIIIRRRRRRQRRRLQW